MNVTVLGTDSCFPAPGNDTACYLVNDELIVDTAWHAADDLAAAGLDPMRYHHLLFTHMHHDHIMGLPGLLFFWLMRAPQSDMRPLHIYGPEETVEQPIRTALDYLGWKDYWPSAQAPTLHPLPGRGSFETETLTVEYLPSQHAVPGRCYRITEKSTGKVLGLSGDTRFFEEEGTFFRHADLLIHEFSGGLMACREQKNGHSSALDAAEAARKADVRCLSLVHGPIKEWDSCVQAAKAQYGGEIRFLEPGKTYEI